MVYNAQTLAGRDRTLVLVWCPLLARRGDPVRMQECIHVRMKNKNVGALKEVACGLTTNKIINLNAWKRSVSKQVSVN